MKTEEAICCAALQVCGSNRLTIFPETQISWDAISVNRRGKGWWMVRGGLSEDTWTAMFPPLTLLSYEFSRLPGSQRRELSHGTQKGHGKRHCLPLLTIAYQIIFLSWSWQKIGSCMFMSGGSLILWIAQIRPVIPGTQYDDIGDIYGKMECKWMQFVTSFLASFQTLGTWQDQHKAG